jgi:TonB family protein
MKEALTRLTLAALGAALCAAAAAARPAQTPAPTPEWVAVSPAGEEFTALMPKEPLRLDEEVRAEWLAASGRRYAAAEGGARYVVWSLTDQKNVGGRVRPLSLPGWPSRGESMYLDLVAEAAWKLLVEPEFERLGAEMARTGRAVNFLPRMPLRREFELGGRPAREYTLRLEKGGGPVYVCAEGRRLYVVAALAPDPNAGASKRFVESFRLRPGGAAPAGEGDAGSGLGPAPLRDSPALVKGPPLQPAPRTNGGAAGAADDYNVPFKQSEVTRKALITGKPEPAFTEGARKFEVTGVVRLRAVLSKTGEVTNINVVKYLPHGLTEKAVEAARGIRFTPAQKDGRAVSQYVVLEYNFNIY